MMPTFSLWLQRVRLPNVPFLVPQGNFDMSLDQHAVTLDWMICPKLSTQLALGCSSLCMETEIENHFSFSNFFPIWPNHQTKTKS
jgi:hypothetical protein